MTHNRTFTAKDPPERVTVRLARSEVAALRELAAGRSLSFAIAGLLKVMRAYRKILSDKS